MAAQTFIRWRHHGAWERLLELAQQRDGIALGMAFLDGSTIRAHQKAAGAAKQGASSAQRDQREALGRSRGGFSTKAAVIVDGSGRAIGFALAPGQANELPMAPVLLSFLTAVALWIVADRGYSSTCLPHADLEPRLASGHSDQAQRSTGGLPALDLHQPQPCRALLVPREG